MTAYSDAQVREIVAERDRLRLKAEQYRQQLDDRWWGVVEQVNTSIEENARLRALAGRLRETLVHTHDESHDTFPSEDCDICALLAETEGQG